MQTCPMEGVCDEYIEPRGGSGRMGWGYWRELRAGEEMRDEIRANLGCLFMAIVRVWL